MVLSGSCSSAPSGLWFWLRQCQWTSTPGQPVGLRRPMGSRNCLTYGPGPQPRVLCPLFPPTRPPAHTQVGVQEGAFQMWFRAHLRSQYPVSASASEMAGSLFPSGLSWLLSPGPMQSRTEPCSCRGSRRGVTGPPGHLLSLPSLRKTKISSSATLEPLICGCPW